MKCFFIYNAVIYFKKFSLLGLFIIANAVLKYMINYIIIICFHFVDTQKYGFILRLPMSFYKKNYFIL